MGYDMRPASWDGQDRPKVSAKLKWCGCGWPMAAHVDTAGMWGASCTRCFNSYSGEDLLGFETWQELVRDWNKKQASS